MEFKGRLDTVYREKLPEGYSQEDQNQRRRKRGLWVPRQGLSRPVGIGQSTERIDSVGYGEVGVKTGLLIGHGGSIDGYAIGANDVTPTWLPPPERNWYYPAPDLGISQPSATNVTLTPSDDNDYTARYLFWRDGEYLGSGQTWTDSPGPGTYVYEAAAETASGVQSDRTTGRVVNVYSTGITDNFNRADGPVTDPSHPWIDGGSTIINIISQVARMTGGIEAALWNAQIAIPRQAHATLIHSNDFTAAAFPQTANWFIGVRQTPVFGSGIAIEGRLTVTVAVGGAISYQIFLRDQFGTVAASATFFGMPNSGEPAVLIIDGTAASFRAGGTIVSGTIATAPSNYYPYMQFSMNIGLSSAGIGWDDFATFGD
jgi:hypothetical protein